MMVLYRSLFLQDEPQTLPPWLLAVISVLLVLLFVWLVLRWRSQQANEEIVRRVSNIEETPVPERAAPVIPVSPEIPTEPVIVPVPEDDLEIIEGIGPKIASILKAAGVTTFTRLAEMAPDSISQVLQAGGIRLADPASWPEQARLAASGDFDGLKALQDRLTAGR